MRPCQKVETFPDGIVDIYEEVDRALGQRLGCLHFENQSVGVNRYYQAQTAVASSRIDRVIKVPHNVIADRLNIAMIQSEGDRQYRITRIQVKPERGVDLWELQSVVVAIKKG